MAHFQDWCETNSLISHTACSFLDPPRISVATKTGVCCSEIKNSTSMEKSSWFCNISGDIFPFTSKAVARIWRHKPFEVRWTWCTANMIYAVWKFQESGDALMYLNSLCEVHSVTTCGTVIENFTNACSYKWVPQLLEKRPVSVWHASIRMQTQ